MTLALKRIYRSYDMPDWLCIDMSSSLDVDEEALFKDFTRWSAKRDRRIDYTIYFSNLHGGDPLDSLIDGLTVLAQRSGADWFVVDYRRLPTFIDYDILIKRVAISYVSISGSTSCIYFDYENRLQFCYNCTNPLLTLPETLAKIESIRETQPALAEELVSKLRLLETS